MECALYIRSHAKEPLSVQGLAEQFGYSACHFSRMFRAEMGVTLMDYVKQQRLFGAAREIREGRKILDTALDYGYETHSGFTRAFRAPHSSVHFMSERLSRKETGRIWDFI